MQRTLRILGRPVRSMWPSLLLPPWNNAAWHGTMARPSKARRCRPPRQCAGLWPCYSCLLQVSWLLLGCTPWRLVRRSWCGVDTPSTSRVPSAASATPENGSFYGPGGSLLHFNNSATSPGCYRVAHGHSVFIFHIEKLATPPIQDCKPAGIQLNLATAKGLGDAEALVMRLDIRIHFLTAPS